MKQKQKRQIISFVGPWDASYVRHQDMNYTLRLSRVGKILQLPEFIGIHHSQEYHDRNWEHFKKGYPILYGRLLRENIDRPLFVLNLLRANRGLATFLLINTLILFLALLASLLPSFTWLTVATITIVLIGIDFTYSTIVKKFNTPQWLLHNYLSPAIIIYGFLKKESLQKRQTEIELIE